MKYFTFMEVLLLPTEAAQSAVALVYLFGPPHMGSPTFGQFIKIALTKRKIFRSPHTQASPPAA